MMVVKGEFIMEQLSLFEYDQQPDMTLAQLADWYFTHYAPNNLKPVTEANYHYMAERFYYPHLVHFTFPNFTTLC